MSFQQLDPPLPVHILDKGAGFAFAVIDYGQEHNLIWVTAISDTGEIWCAPNPRVRMQANWTMGRATPAAVAADKGNCVDLASPVTPYNPAAVRNGSGAALFPVRSGPAKRSRWSIPTAFSSSISAAR